MVHDSRPEITYYAIILLFGEGRFQREYGETDCGHDFVSPKTPDDRLVRYAVRQDRKRGKKASMNRERREFLNTAGLLCMTPVFGQEKAAPTARRKEWKAQEYELYLRAVKASDEVLPRYLAQQEQRAGHKMLGGHIDEFGIHTAGGTAGLLKMAGTVYCTPESSWYHRKDLLPRLQQAVRFLLAAQNQDGTINLYITNFHSTPDTAFVVEPLSYLVALLRQDGSEELQPLRADLDRFMTKAAEALRMGGVHTPNHRWVVCGALALLHRLYPDKRLVDRIENWLGEGIDIDADGQYTERSTSIYSPHVDRVLLTVAHILQKPELLDPIRRNLEMNLYYLHADGEVVTEASHRQDQYTRGTLVGYYIPYRTLAMRDRNGRFAAAARLIEDKLGNGIAAHLAQFQVQPEILGPLPPSLPLPSDFVKHFPHSELVRIRRGASSATILAKYANFFSFHKGSAALESIRMAHAFFGKGQFLSPTLEIQDNTLVLRQSMEGWYYQPIAKEYRNPDGNWRRMDNSKRERSEVQNSDARVTIREAKGEFQFEFSIQGCDQVPVAISLHFRRGGKLQGVVPVKGIPDAFLLESGMGTYTFGDQTIEFGPGLAEHSYTQIRMSLPKPDALSVYLTGFTPFLKKLIVR